MLHNHCLQQHEGFQITVYWFYHHPEVLVRGGDIMAEFKFSEVARCSLGSFELAAYIAYSVSSKCCSKRGHNCEFKFLGGGGVVCEARHSPRKFDSLSLILSHFSPIPVF